jgi:hypothetical protein
MELYLNCAWMFAAVASACLWVRLGRRASVDRHLSLVGLLPFNCFLFPVISVSDDLSSIQNPAEAKTIESRNQCVDCPHFAFKVIATMRDTAVSELKVGFLRLNQPLQTSLLSIDNPAVYRIQNRPPPSA